MMLPFFSQPPPSPHLDRVCLLTLSLVARESSLSSPSLLIPLTSSPTPLIPSASLPNPPLQVYWRSRDRCVVSYSPDTTSSSKVPAHPLLRILMTYLLPYDKVNINVLNTLLLVLFPMTVFHLACVHLHGPYLLSLFIPQKNIYSFKA